MTHRGRAGKALPLSFRPSVCHINSPATIPTHTHRGRAERPCPCHSGHPSVCRISSPATIPTHVDKFMLLTADRMGTLNKPSKSFLTLSGSPRVSGPKTSPASGKKLTLQYSSPPRAEVPHNFPPNQLFLKLFQFGHTVRSTAGQ